MSQIDTADTLLADLLDAIATKPPLERITALKIAGTIIKHNTRSAVGQAREQEASWQQIADALGVSRSAAWQRYSGPAPLYCPACEALDNTLDHIGCEMS